MSSNLKNLIQKEMENRLDIVVTTEIFPKFLEIANHSVQKNYYDLYKPIRYQRKYRLKNKWILQKNKKDYEIYINENIKGEWDKKLYYLPQLILEGKVVRKENGIITHTPRPFISDLKIDLNKDRVFQNLLSKYGLNIK